VQQCIPGNKKLEGEETRTGTAIGAITRKLGNVPDAEVRGGHPKLLPYVPALKTANFQDTFLLKPAI
jgi:hypothetical protein